MAKKVPSAAKAVSAHFKKHRTKYFAALILFVGLIGVSMASARRTAARTRRQAGDQAPAGASTPTTSTSFVTPQGTPASVPQVVDLNSITSVTDLLTKRPELRMGMSGNAVKHLQDILRTLGYGKLPANSTTYFGPLTAEAVKEYQNAISSLTADGIVGVNTWASLSSSVALHNASYAVVLADGELKGAALVEYSQLTPTPTLPTSAPQPNSRCYAPERAAAIPIYSYGDGGKVLVQASPRQFIGNFIGTRQLTPHRLMAVIQHPKGQLVMADMDHLSFLPERTHQLIQKY